MARPSDRGTSMTVATVIRTTTLDKEMIRQAAMKEGMSTSVFIRRVLAKYGVFPMVRVDEEA